MDCYRCQKTIDEVIEMGNINQYGDITTSVFICQNCLEELSEVDESESPDYYDYPAGIYLRDDIDHS